MFATMEIQWVNDLRHGKGMYIHSNGEIFIGEYKNDERVENSNI
nr:MORN repeat-containing protein [Clostridium sporogenes]